MSSKTTISVLQFLFVQHVSISSEIIIRSERTLKKKLLYKIHIIFYILHVVSLEIETCWTNRPTNSFR